MNLKSTVIVSLLLLICGWTLMFNCPAPMVSVVFNVLSFLMSLKALRQFEEGEDLF